MSEPRSADLPPRLKDGDAPFERLKSERLKKAL